MGRVFVKSSERMDLAKNKIEFQEFIIKWKTISERGADILRIAAAQRDGSFNYVEDISNVVVELKAELDEMYAFLGNVLENNSVVLQYKDEGIDEINQNAALKDHIRQLQACVHMFDQDYVMKETIQAILSSSSQISSVQHLNGFYSTMAAARCYGHQPWASLMESLELAKIGIGIDITNEHRRDCELDLCQNHSTSFIV
ncbi:hypothetical protein INT43_000604 [Umbelopsis isabellina]|uniref:Uncharacterized protein n=1 Tax=Mortierella isabellina TaxID=91625 RepID=A0A8H7Q2M1_MORIS|nr:hypothetical protein INT43_000604 [Umbelopsis isabellina]